MWISCMELDRANPKRYTEPVNGIRYGKLGLIDSNKRQGGVSRPKSLSIFQGQKQPRLSSLLYSIHHPPMIDPQSDYQIDGSPT